MDSCLLQQGVKILAIERGGESIHFPEQQEVILTGDHLLCYGIAEAILASRFSRYFDFLISGHTFLCRDTREQVSSRGS